MRRWERRLKDLSIALETCGSNYFEPELFRLNANHFLTTSRTVSFLFQKDKSSINNFGDWHANNIVIPWKNDEIMKWSITARNTIEKEGDLELHSSVHVKLIIGYIEENDIPLSIDKNTCLGASIKRLIRFARAELPTGVSDTSVIKIERTWIANTLPQHELLQALLYIYTRMFEACHSLAKHLGTELEASIPHPTLLDETITGSRGVHYVKCNSNKIGVIRSKRQYLDESFKAPEWLKEIKEKRLSPPSSLNELVQTQAEMAEAVFKEHGNHVAMLWLYNENYEIIDFIVTAPSDQADKYIFWRTIADKIHYLKAKYLVWTAEAWIRRGLDPRMTKLTRNLPITGEILHVTGIDGKGNTASQTWNIRREPPESHPTLEIRDAIDDPKIKFNYLIPVRKALEKVAAM